MKVNFSNVNLENIDKYEERALAAFDTLMGRNGEGNDFLGWIDRPVDYDKDEFERIKKAATRIRENSDVLVSIGIGGSYLGIKAVDVACDSYFNSKRKTKIIYAGHQLSGEYLVELLDYLKDKDYSLNVISKSGTTTEPAIAFRVLKEALEERKKQKTEFSQQQIRLRELLKNSQMPKAMKVLSYQMILVEDFL